MPRLVSVALTEQAVVERRKTVTRRLGWRNHWGGLLANRDYDRIPDPPNRTGAAARAELVQVAAVAVAAIEPMDRAAPAVLGIGEQA